MATPSKPLSVFSHRMLAMDRSRRMLRNEKRILSELSVCLRHSQGMAACPMGGILLWCPFLLLYCSEHTRHAAAVGRNTMRSREGPPQLLGFGSLDPGG